MSEFRPIDEGYVSRNFNDRRIGGRNTNRAFGQSYKKEQEPKYVAPHTPDRKQFPDKGIGGTKVPRTPKTPRSPMPARAVAVKHRVKGY